MKIFGIMKKNGTLTICKAKPENRGKGKCKHFDHIEVSEEELKAGFIQQYNEKVYQEKAQKDFASNYPDVTSENIQTHPKNAVLSKKELVEGANKISQKINNKDLSIIQEFYEKYNRTMNDVEKAEILSSDPVVQMKKFMESNDESAKKLRSFLGKEINTQNLSELLIYSSGSMTKSLKWQSNGSNSIRRVILSSLNNDMTKERYVASVLFFGGRCCYCNKILKREGEPDELATAEHITPISPDSDDSVSGGTRYGNMALACRPCNGSRGNSDLIEWLQKTNRIKKVNKERVLGRIQAFRDFCLYSEYSKEENAKIMNKIDELNKMRTILGRGETLEEDREKREKIREAIKIAIFDLQHGHD